MRILQIAPPWESVPPAAYGGTEAVVHILVEELILRGHQVVLCASGDSETSARLHATYGRSLRTARDLHEKLPYVVQHASEAIQQARGFDIVHNHAGEEVMALAPLTNGVPMVTTMHCNVTADRQFVWDRYEGHYNTVSWGQKRAAPRFQNAVFAGVAYNGIDVQSFPFEQEKDDYLLFMSRVSPEKGTHIAIEAARRVGRRLVIAGKVDDADYGYYTEMVEPLVDGRQTIYAGEADAVRKRKLYKKASGVLMPIVWEEPFGLVMAEAQACGTPVIAFRRGAAPEIVRDGETGFVVDDIDGMVEGIGRLGEIDQAACRRWVEEKFDAPRMADRYLELYRQILSPRKQPTEPMPGALLPDAASQTAAEHVA